ncbi:MAG: acyl-CoA dehydrogenase family protein [Solirubrobacteraceae bacterium]
MSAQAPEQIASLDGALEQVASLAGSLDASPRFPRESFDALSAAGVPQLPGDRASASLRSEIELVRAVAAADASVARILDGHINGVERLSLLADEPLRSEELRAVREGRLLIGVWGADPGRGEGEPARLQRNGGGAFCLTGVKTFCSGAGGVDRALVVVGRQNGARMLAYVDVHHGIRIDRGWYRASGLKASESHRVLFEGAPVLALLGGPDELAREPHFSADAIRSAATWAGIAERIFAETLTETAGAELDEVRLRRIGQMRVALSSIDRWLDHAGARLEAAKERTAAGERFAADRAVSIEARVAISDAARLISGSAAEISGSRALATAGPLDRARRDLDLFLLQHRLDRKLVEVGELARGGAR